MITDWPSPDGTPDEPDATQPVPDEVWRKFLCDSEHAIRVSAPREPSARERRRGPSPADGTTGTRDATGAGATTGAGDAGGRGPRRGGDRARERAGRRRPAAPDPVDGVWGPDDPWAGPAWRELDGRARLRRAGRVVATGVAITLALGAWSHLSTGAGTPVDGGPHRTTVEQLDGLSNELPSAPRVPPGSAGVARPPSSSPAAG
ncbi:MAG TPA: hypothetical protein VFP69_17625 [Streptomyces sp.]|nr:hypothetical protein [Streptomyces sp.]